jgi:2-polyprenyl-3-methyl-5-hydroxy-6-metoxy-1,4-benzoquinol methylase
VTANDAWKQLLPDYEEQRAREDSLDRLMEWDAQQALIGDLSGMDVLDVGCGNGEKAIQMAVAGARSVVGLDVAGQFLTPPPAQKVSLAAGDVSDLDQHPLVQGRRFDVIVFLQSLGYARDQTSTLQAARSLLRDDGVLVVSRAHPIRFAVERAESEGIPLGDAYHAATPPAYASSWNPEIQLTHSADTFAGMVNTLVRAGFWIEQILEPQLSEENRIRFPHKQEWLSRHIGIIIFRARPLPHST